VRRSPPLARQAHEVLAEVRGDLHCQHAVQQAARRVLVRLDRELRISSFCEAAGMLTGTPRSQTSPSECAASDASCVAPLDALHICAVCRSATMQAPSTPLGGSGLSMHCTRVTGHM